MDTAGREKPIAASGAFRKCLHAEAGSILFPSEQDNGRSSNKQHQSKTMEHS